MIMPQTMQAKDNVTFFPVEWCREMKAIEATSWAVLVGFAIVFVVTTTSTTRFEALGRHNAWVQSMSNLLGWGTLEALIPYQLHGFIVFDQIVYHLVTFVLRLLDGAFFIYHSLRQVSTANVSSTDTWSDEDIIRAVLSAPRLEGSDRSLVRISEDTVVKFCLRWESATSEALAMILVCEQTRIVVPRVRRVIRYFPDGSGLIVMDLVEDSQRLQVVWPSLSFFGKLKVVLTMRFNLRELRRIQHSLRNNRPGPLGLTPRFCHGLQFGFDSKGPFPTLSALESYFRKEHEEAEYRASRNWAPPPNCPPLNSSAFTSLVFTHNDLNMRNLLLDKNNVLWVIDFGFAGFFPPWFEYLGMRYAAFKDENPESWKHCIKYMAYPAFEIEEWMKRIGYDYSDLP